MKLVKYLPYENYVLISKLSADEVVRRLADNVEPKKSSIFFIAKKSTNKPYKGQISGNTFTISRIINYRNSFLPVITGHISAFHDETHISITMQPIIFVLIFICFWLGVVGLICLEIIVSALSQIRQILQHGFSPITLLPFGMFLFGCLLTIFAFKTESKKSKKFLEQLLSGHENT